jgi:ribosomal protein S24E
MIVFLSSSILSSDCYVIHTEFCSTLEHKNRKTVSNLVLQGVAICDINVEKAESAVKHLETEFGKDRAIFLKTDVSKEVEIEGITSK